MPHATFSIDPDGLAFFVMIGLSGDDMAERIVNRQPIPRPLRLRGILDTGSDVTCVSSPIFQHFNLAPIQQTTTQTAGGPATVNLFEVSLTIPSVGGLTGPLLVLDILVVMALADPPSATIDVLVGRDVLLRLLSVIDGPRGNFTLAD
jgi:hypothetical protein